MLALLSNKHFLGTLVWLMLALPSLWGQAKFKTTITPDAIGKTETVVLRLMVENANEVAQIIPPSLKDFTVLSGPNQESGMESINGVTRQYIGIAYLLQPKKTGRFTIRGATAKADGKTLTSNAVTLRVGREPTGNSQRPSAGGFGGFSPYPEPPVPSGFNDYILRENEDVAEKISKNIFLHVDMSKPSCYVGEPVVVTYKLYTRLKSESSITKNPSFNGFSVIDLLPPGSNNYTVEKFDGREYNVYILRKSQLYPLQAGPVALESAEVENDIHFIKEAYARNGGLSDLFRDFAQTSVPPQAVHNERVTLQSKPAIVQVKALPENGRPASFKGAVGSFVIAAAVDKQQLSTDDAAKLTLGIKGAGNMSMIISPDIEWPKGIEPYDSRSTEQVDKLTVPVSGTKYFDFPFTVAEPGTYTLPPVSFSYFDVNEGQYKTISTNPITIQVSKGSGKRTYLPATGNEHKSFVDTIFTNRWLIVIPLIVLVLAGLLVWLQTDRRRKPVVAMSGSEPVITPASEKPAPEVTETLQPASGNPLAESVKRIEWPEARDFYHALNKEFKQFLAVKFALEPEQISKKTIATALETNGISLGTSLEIQGLLDAIEWQLYTPFAEAALRQTIYERALAVVQQLTNSTTQ